jgi:hypothetical protein
VSWVVSLAIEPPLTFPSNVCQQRIEDYTHFKEWPDSRGKKCPLWDEQLKRETVESFTAKRELDNFLRSNFSERFTDEVMASFHDDQEVQVAKSQEEKYPQAVELIANITRRRVQDFLARRGIQS